LTKTKDMPEFNDTRSQLNKIRGEAEQLSLSLFHARQRVERLREARKGLERRFDPNNPRHVAESRRLEQEIARTEALSGQLSERLRGVNAGLSRVWESFAPLADPRESIGELSAGYPILLFPLRLETRFKTVRIGERERSQLWVRIYPDDCLVDDFEPTPSEMEIDNLWRYWAGVWNAGGDEELWRAAWRNLAASHGPGRAAYLAEIYQPGLDSDPKPTRAGDDEIYLIIATSEPLDAAEQKLLNEYWEALWRAGDNTEKRQAAFDALSDAAGAEKAERWNELYQPFNIFEAPPAGVDRAEAKTKVLRLVFPKPEEAPMKNASWTQAARAHTLPERFVLIAESGADRVELLGNPVVSPLIVSPDPFEAADKQLQLDDEGRLLVPEYLRWMTDFEAAVQAGMGFRLDLSATQAAGGFDRLYVVGVRLGADEMEGKKLLENLLLHHQRGGKGFALVPQGTPTNNTEQGSSGYSSLDDADVYFDLLRRIEANGFQFDPSETDDKRKADGLWLAEYTGIDPAILQNALHADGRDQCEARAMNTALFPGTLGYWLDTQMQPVFNDDAIGRIRDFFNQYVSGRGAIPAVRVGDQPYGILPATRFSQMRWLSLAGTPVTFDDPERRFLANLYAVLRQLDEAFWKKFAAEAPHVGKAADNPQQLLLDLVGLHPTSVEFYQQWAESIEQLWNRLQFLYFMPWLPLWSKIMALLAGGPALLASFGYKGATPELLEKIFLKKPNLLDGPLVDRDPPLSELEPLQIVTDDGKNYIEWLIDKASTNMDDLRAQRGFAEGMRPTALLYLQLRHALELGYYDMSLQLRRRSQLLNDEDYRRLRGEPAFVHVAEQNRRGSDSRYEWLYKTEPRITGSDTLSVAQYIPLVLREPAFVHYLPQQIEALKHLAKTPTARLERLFAEHIDCCAYRWDAWMLGLAHYRLRQIRRRVEPSGQQSVSKGVYLGAFGWVEDLRPDRRAIGAPTLPPELDEIFNRGDEPPLMSDRQNGGFVHAPSLNHAVTAAVLRNGYLHNATPSEPGLLAVNLSSERVRRALQFLEGIRNGQSLGALLGYQFERALHDRYEEAEVDFFIHEIRKAFPLRARRIKDTLPDEDEPIEHIEARNVVDGSRLTEHVRNSAVKTYPWGKNLQRGTAEQESIINQELDRLLDTQDAIADLAVAESVHQAVQGNYDRAAAALDAYSRATFPPDPDVVATPRSGVTLTQRVGLHLSANAPAGATPRAAAEPAINQWLAGVLPPLHTVVVVVSYRDPISGVSRTDEVSCGDLSLAPIDVLYLLDAGNQQAMTEVDDRVYHFILNKHHLRPDAEVKLLYTESAPGKITFFEAQPLISSLRSLLTQSRPLRPGDVAIPNEAESEAEGDVFVPEARVANAKTSVAALRDAAAAVRVLLEPTATLDLDAATDAEVDAALNQIDAWLELFIDLQLSAGNHGIALSGFGGAIAWRKDFFAGIIQQANELGQRWLEKANEYAQLVADAAAPGLTPEEVYDLLLSAERLISTTYTLPLPANPADFIVLLATKKTAFDAALAQVDALQATTQRQIKGLLAEWEAIAILAAAHDLQAIDTIAERRRVLLFIQDLYEQTAGLHGEIERRLAAADERLDAAADSSGEQKALALSEALQKLLGEEFRVIWHFTLRAAQGDEWQNAWNDRLQLTAWLESEGVDFPVDDWLYSVARVRSKLHDWENVTQLAGAFGRPEPALTPLQFPFVAGEPWLALDCPPDFDAQTTGDRLLYTACYGGGDFDKNQTQCGLLLDEWTEVLPGKEETTGLAFHYDRPNNEPPQAILLAIPSDIGERWTWEELTGAIVETFHMAKKRAAEPSQVEATALARFLPATVAAVTLRGISLSHNLAVNNQFEKYFSNG
jgi:hypothetical protein